MRANLLRYASDFHLEFHSLQHPKLIPYWEFQKNKNCNYHLALLGDIGNPLQKNLHLFFEKISPKYQKIYYVPGNHEYYNLDQQIIRPKEEFDLQLINLCKKFSNIILMNNKIDYIDDTKIIGSTL